MATSATAFPNVPEANRPTNIGPDAAPRASVPGARANRRLPAGSLARVPGMWASPRFQDIPRIASPIR